MEDVCVYGCMIGGGFLSETFFWAALLFFSKPAPVAAPGCELSLHIAADKPQKHQGKVKTADNMGETGGTGKNAHSSVEWREANMSRFAKGCLFFLQQYN